MPTQANHCSTKISSVQASGVHCSALSFRTRVVVLVKPPVLRSCAGDVANDVGAGALTGFGGLGEGGAVGGVTLKAGSGACVLKAGVGGVLVGIVKAGIGSPAGVGGSG